MRNIRGMPFCKIHSEGHFRHYMAQIEGNFQQKTPHGTKFPWDGTADPWDGNRNPRDGSAETPLPTAFPTLKGGQRWPSALTVCHIAHKALRRGGIPAAHTAARPQEGRHSCRPPTCTAIAKKENPGGALPRAVGGIPAAPPKAHRETSAPIGGELLITAGRPQAHPRSREAADRQKLTAEKPPPTRRCAPLRHPPRYSPRTQAFPSLFSRLALLWLRPK